MILLPDAAATDRLGRAIAHRLRPGDVIALQGTLGAGKTSLARGILAGLGLTGEAPSPSFAIVQPYDPPEVRLPALHVDLYRLNTAAELDELGLDEALHDAALIVEWPERAGEHRWPEALVLQIVADTRDPSGVRRLTPSVPPGWKDRWPI